MNSLEHLISSQKLEIEHLKSNKEQLNNSLKEANQTLELLKKKVRKKYVSVVNYMRPNGLYSKTNVRLGTSAPELWRDLDTAFVSLMRI